MKKLLLLSALLIFACSSGGDSNDNNNNNNSELLNCDGNPVPTIVYGTQEWTVENACYTTYRDGTPIPQVTDYTEWENLTTGAWTYYANSNNKLYNYYAAAGIHSSASILDPTLRKQFAPEGWHVPSNLEWRILEEFLIINGHTYDGTTNLPPDLYTGYWTNNKLAKALASTSGWGSSTYTGTPGNDQGSNNSSGFNVIPIGNYIPPIFNLNSQGNITGFWTSTNYPNEDGNPFDDAWYMELWRDSENFREDATRSESFKSIRLVKDN